MHNTLGPTIMGNIANAISAATQEIKLDDGNTIIDFIKKFLETHVAGLKRGTTSQIFTDQSCTELQPTEQTALKEIISTYRHFNTLQKNAYSRNFKGPTLAEAHASACSYVSKHQAIQTPSPSLRNQGRTRSQEHLLGGFVSPEQIQALKQYKTQASNIRSPDQVPLPQTLGRTTPPHQNSPADNNHPLMESKATHQPAWGSPAKTITRNADISRQAQKKHPENTWRGTFSTLGASITNFFHWGRRMPAAQVTTESPLNTYYTQLTADDVQYTNIVPLGQAVKRTLRYSSTDNVLPSSDELMLAFTRLSSEQKRMLFKELSSAASLTHRHQNKIIPCISLTGLVALSLGITAVSLAPNKDDLLKAMVAFLISLINQGSSNQNLIAKGQGSDPIDFVTLTNGAFSATSNVASKTDLNSVGETASQAIQGKAIYTLPKQIAAIPESTNCPAGSEFTPIFTPVPGGAPNQYQIVNGFCALIAQTTNPTAAASAACNGPVFQQLTNGQPQAILGNCQPGTTVSLQNVDPNSTFKIGFLIQPGSTLAIAINQGYPFGTFGSVLYDQRFSLSDINEAFSVILGTQFVCSGQNNLAPPVIFLVTQNGVEIQIFLQNPKGTYFDSSTQYSCLGASAPESYQSDNIISKLPPQRKLSAELPASPSISMSSMVLKNGVVIPLILTVAQEIVMKVYPDLNKHAKTQLIMQIMMSLLVVAGTEFVLNPEVVVQRHLANALYNIFFGLGISLSANLLLRAVTSLTHTNHPPTPDENLAAIALPESCVVIEMPASKESEKTGLALSQVAPSAIILSVMVGVQYIANPQDALANALTTVATAILATGVNYGVREVAQQGISTSIANVWNRLWGTAQGVGAAVNDYLENHGG